MNTLKQVVGIDVGSKELFICIGQTFANLDKKLFHSGNLRNTHRGLIKLQEWVQAQFCGNPSSFRHGSQGV
jgi:transposase